MFFIFSLNHNDRELFLRDLFMAFSERDLWNKCQLFLGLSGDFVCGHVTAWLHLIGEMESNVTSGYVGLVKQSRVTAPEAEVSLTSQNK